MKPAWLALPGWWKAGAGLAAAALLVLAPFAVASDRHGVGVDAATVATALEGPCLMPAPEMRRHHPALLAQERVRAVRRGQRNPRHSIERCVACHAIADASGDAIPHEDERHFCRACHLRVAVAADCFSCHRSTPAGSRSEPAS